MFNASMPEGGQTSSQNQETPVANNQTGSVYPRSYGTDDAPKGKSNYGANKTQNTQNGQDSYAQSMEDKGTLLTAPANGIQSIDDYDLQFSPETVVDHVMIDDFKNFAFNNQMSLESAQQVASFYESFIQKGNTNYALQSRIQENEMRNSCENDVEFGGAKFHENLRYAKAAMTRFDDGSLGKILTDSGFGSHPEVVRFMFRVGQALSEKSMAMGQSPQRELSAAELFYPSMRKG